MKTEVYINEIELGVIYYFNKGQRGTRDLPPVADSIDVLKIFYHGNEITESEAVELTGARNWELLKEKIEDQVLMVTI